MKKQPWKFKLAVYLILSLIILLLFSRILPPVKNIFSGSIFIFNFESRDLYSLVSSIPKASGTYAIYIEDLSSGEKYTQNENQVMPAASLYKLFLLAAVIEELEKGPLKEESTISASKTYLTKRFGSVDFGYETSPETISYSLKEALERIGRISDNFAAIMLTDKVGIEKVADQARKIGAKNTSMKDLTTTAADIASFFKKLYQGEVISPAASVKIIDYLSLNQLDSRIPAGVPEGVKIIHKTGELSRIRHDGGIVYPPAGGPYILVLMSQDLKDEDKGVETLKEISKRVYEYFSAKVTKSS